MKENNTSGFKFKVDDDERPDSLFQTKKRKETAAMGKEDALNQRITLLSLLMLCLIGLIVFGAYLHVEKKFEKIYSAGSTEIQIRSQDLESKFSALAGQYEELQASLIKKVSQAEAILSKLENTTASMEAHLKQLEKNLNRVSASKANKKTLADAITRVDKNLTPMRKDIADLKSFKGPDIASFDKKFTEALAKLFGEVDDTKKEFDKLQTDISDLSTDSIKGKISKLQIEISELLTNKVSRESLDIALEDQEKQYKENLILINENLGYKEDQIKALQKRLETIETRLNVKKKKYHKPSKPSNSLKSGTEDLEPGKILEQDIE